MDDPRALLTLGVLYAVLWLFGKISKSGKQPAPGAPPRKRVPGKPETLEDLLAEMRGELERAQELDEAEPELASRELPAPVVSPTVVTFDDAAEAVVASRIKQAAARDGALNAADHARFDRMIRQKAPVVVVDTRRRDALRKAIVWREILGPPKGMQDG